MEHPLHRAVAKKIAEVVGQRIKLVRDPACDGDNQLPLFVGRHKARDTRMCCVDILLISDSPSPISHRPRGQKTAEIVGLTCGNPDSLSLHQLRVVGKAHWQLRLSEESQSLVAR